MAWKGVEGDEGIYFATLNDISGVWIDQSHVPGVGGAVAPGTSVGPCLAVFNHQLYMAWKGVEGDQTIWWTTYDDLNGWAPQHQVVGSDGVVPSTSVGPSLAVFNDQLYMAWKGVQGDQSIWWTSTSDGQHWASQNQIALGFGYDTSVGPSLAVLNSTLYMAWKGVDGDEGIYWAASSDGQDWGAQLQVCGVGTSVGPCLAAYNSTLYMAWKGVEGDDGIYWTFFGFNPGLQQNVPGADTNPGELAV